MNASHAPILICYDGSSGSARVIEVAGRLFAGRRAIVLYVSSAAVTEHVHTTSVEGVRQELIEEVRVTARRDAAAIADEGARKTADAGLAARPLTMEAEDGVANAIVRVATKESVAAVVIGRPHRTRLGQLMRGSASRHVIEETSLPVILV